VTKDPIGFGGGDYNLYVYVKNNSINLKDPLGLYAELCQRDFYPLFIVPAKHCYIRFNGNVNDTLSFTNKGVGKDAAPSWWFGQSCSKTNGIQDDCCVRREFELCMKKEKWALFGFNCCHCAESALKACGLSSSNGWPNWPINPGPQPGEKGYKQ